MNVGDIVEHETRSAEPPQPKEPVMKPRKSLFARKSARRQPAKPPQPPLSDAEKIHLDNVKRLASMSPQDIASEKDELISNVDPKILASLLRRAELRESSHVQDPPASSTPVAVHPSEMHTETYNRNIGEASSDQAAAMSGYGPEDPPPVPPNELEHPQRNPQSHLAPHFPPPPEELKKYFSELPVETEKLAWMRPIDDADEAEYNPEMISLAPSELRFDFRGDLITPRMSRLISTDQGLHHHGDAPSAAGYTLAELAHLSRSSNPSQRSLALRTAGRVLHKLRVGKFNKSTDLQGGLETLVDQTRVLDSIMEATSDRNLTVRTVATEAAWLAQAEPSKQ